MSEGAKPPGYMAQLLEALGWNQGTRIPLADAANKELETQLIDRQTELQRLKEALTSQKQKKDDLNNYKKHVYTEYQENTRLLFAHKQQMEQEVKLRQLSANEADRLDRDVVDSQKQSKEIENRIDRLQTMISNLLRKADSMKSVVCGERGALEEWRAALDRYSCDITAMEQFTKQDMSKAKELETKRQKLKLEHDRMHERLVQLVSNLSAEERACDRISIQVTQGMEERKQMMAMWTAAVENLRQRDKDIRHIREDYEVLEKEANKLAEQCREQQAFCDQQRGNNNDARLENMALASQLSQIRISYQKLAEDNATLDSEAQSLQRELSNMRNTLEKLHMENRRYIDEQLRIDNALKTIDNKIQELKAKLTESMDKSKSSEKRAKELEEILNDEERYASQITTNQQRAMHCSFIEQQKLLALQNEEKLFFMQLKASKAVCSKLQCKQRGIQRLLQTQKESLYNICYQVETIGARVSHMEGAQAERECSAVLVERENRMKNVYARHAARVSLLERHSAKLHDDMRRLAREVEHRSAEHTKLQSRLKTSMLNVEGGEKELRQAREEWRRARVTDALLRLRVAHAARALAGLDDTAFNLDEQRLHIDAAMNERLVEIKARREMFSVQKRALLEDCGKLRGEIRERQQRIDQLIKRYTIFVDSLGKDDSGQQLSVTYFKIKWAAERAELRERGAALDAELARRERDVSALEATLRVVHHAHHHFMHHISPLKDDTPEMEELNNLRSQFHAARDSTQALQSNIARLRQHVADAEPRLAMLRDKNNQLAARQAESEQELDVARERMERQQTHLQHARELVRVNAKRAQKLVEGMDEWRMFQVSQWNRDMSEAAHTAVVALNDLAAAAPEVAPRLAALVAQTDLLRLVPSHMRRLRRVLHKLVAEKAEKDKKEPCIDIEESLFSSSSSSTKSGVSLASGYTKRLAGFRRQLAPKVQEEALINDIPDEARRSTVSLRVITLALESTSIVLDPTGPGPLRRSLLK
ncbi:coiled-coil domain-containing protein 39 [Helicoverpa zea]|uniref:coiled-coil domain-containing protein 39 n=1 Tax=Helicoverpa zea TaxID=7113 RepID=UPI001F56EF40|nr:coiled-coil domain-containing protein 39 [Helicoverpa zea]